MIFANSFDEPGDCFCSCFFILDSTLKRYHYYSKLQSEIPDQVDLKSFATYAPEGLTHNGQDGLAPMQEFKHIPRKDDAAYERMLSSLIDAREADGRRAHRSHGKDSTTKQQFVPLASLSSTQLRSCLLRAQLTRAAEVLHANDVTGADAAAFSADDLEEFGGPEGVKRFQRQKLITWIRDATERGIPRGALLPLNASTRQNGSPRSRSGSAMTSRSRAAKRGLSDVRLGVQPYVSPLVGTRHDPVRVLRLPWARNEALQLSPCALSVTRVLWLVVLYLAFATQAFRGAGTSFNPAYSHGAPPPPPPVTGKPRPYFTVFALAAATMTS